MAFAGSAPKVPTGAWSNYDGTFNVEYADGTSIYAYTGTDDSAVAVNCPGELVFSRYFIETNPDEPNPPRFMYRYREADVMTNEFTMFLDLDCSWVYPISGTSAHTTMGYGYFTVTYSDSSTETYHINSIPSGATLTVVTGAGPQPPGRTSYTYTENGYTTPTFTVVTTYIPKE